jgi:ribosome biogenesis GTPase A
MRIIDYLDKKGGNILKRFYGVGNLKGQEMFDAIGDKKRYRLKGGGIDENRTAIRIISDWQDGKIKLK